MGQVISLIQPKRDCNEPDKNGMIFGGKYIPKELIEITMLQYMDIETLLNCQQVCQSWRKFTINYIWRRKAEMASGQKFSPEDDLDWRNYYLLCFKKQPFGKNLLKNHSESKGLEKLWDEYCLTKLENTSTNSQRQVECQLLKALALPIEAGFGNTSDNFFTCSKHCRREQTIDLIEEGFTADILDNMQPTIEINGWYCYKLQLHTFSMYWIFVSLLEDNKIEACEAPMNTFKFNVVLRRKEQNKWHKVTHEFKNYGKGLRKISFIHESYSINEYRNVIMTKGRMRVKVPNEVLNRYPGVKKKQNAPMFCIYV